MEYSNTQNQRWTKSTVRSLTQHSSRSGEIRLKLHNMPRTVHAHSLQLGRRTGYWSVADHVKRLRIIANMFWVTVITKIAGHHGVGRYVKWRKHALLV